jgi:cytochrome c-type biogenesis protein CcmE
MTTVEAADTEDEAPKGTAEAGATESNSVNRRRKKRRLRFWIAGAVLLGAFGFLLAEGLSNSLNYFETVNQAVKMKSVLGTTTFRLEGLVVPGSIKRTSSGVDFSVESSGVTEAVIETGLPPQLFQDNIPVVLVGHFAGPVFASNQILVDHSSQYIEEYPNRVRAPNGSVRSHYTKEQPSRVRALNGSVT